jgi:hypothetical protein
MYEVKVSGNSPEELVTNLRSLADVMGGQATAAPAVKAKAEPKAEAKKKLTEDDVRNAWAAKKEKGFVGTDLAGVLAGFVIGTNDDNEDVVAKKISELLPDQYADAIKAFNALSK